MGKFTINVVATDCGWRVSRAERPESLYGSREHAVESADCMALAHTMLTGYPSCVLLETAAGERSIVAQYG